MEFVNSREAMAILGFKSMTTLAKYDKELKVTYPFGNNRRRYKVSNLIKFLNK